MNYYKHMMFTIRWIIALECSLLACSYSPKPIEPISANACEVSCIKREKLNCIEQNLIPMCTHVCKKAVEKGIYDPTCAASANDQKEMQECNVRCQ